MSGIASQVRPVEPTTTRKTPGGRLAMLQLPSDAEVAFAV
jgi:hypothetical protein